MDTRQLEQFIAVVDQGSVSGAARRLLLSQPTVSQTIRELEAELGTTLFRRGRGMAPTPSGRALVGPARQVLRGLAGARAAVDEVKGLLAGEVTIAIPPTIYGAPLTHLVAAYLRRHPRIHVILDEAPPGPEAFGLLDRGDIELLVHDATPPSERHDSIVLGTSKTVAVFPPTETDLPDGPVTLADLAGRRTVAGRAPGPELRPRFLAEFTEAELTPPEIVAESSDRRTILALVMEGAGMCIVPDFEAVEAERLGAIVRPLEPDFPRTTKLHSQRGDLTPAARAFVDLAGTG